MVRDPLLMPQINVSFESCEPIPEHARLIMALRNDPVTLSISYHREPKVWDAFWQEYQTACFGDQVPPMFILDQGERTGFIRCRRAPHPNHLAGLTVDISINIGPGRRGKGLGQAALRAVKVHLSEHFAVDSIYAEVRQENGASYRAFLGTGFTDLGLAPKHIPDTGETCQIHRLIAELTSVFWRSRSVYVIAEAGSNWRVG